MASFASSATTCGARKHAWTNSINKDHYFVSISLTKKGCTISKSLLWKASIFLNIITNRISELLLSVR